MWYYRKTKYIQSFARIHIQNAKLLNSFHSAESINTLKIILKFSWDLICGQRNNKILNYYDSNTTIRWLAVLGTNRCTFRRPALRTKYLVQESIKTWIVCVRNSVQKQGDIICDTVHVTLKWYMLISNYLKHIKPFLNVALRLFLLKFKSYLLVTVFSFLLNNIFIVAILDFFLRAHLASLSSRYPNIWNIPHSPLFMIYHNMY